MPSVSSNFDSAKLYSPKMREREIEPYKKRVEAVAAEVTIKNNTGTALQQLFDLTDKFQKAMAPFTTAAGRNGLFDQKKAAITTNDVGNGSDYANISVDNTVHKGQFSMRVDSVATASSITLCADGPGNGFAHGLTMGTYIGGLNGGVFNVATPPKVMITSANVTYSVIVPNAADTIYDIRNYINTQLGGNNIRADVIRNAAGEEFLAVSNTVTGVNVLGVQFNSGHHGVLNNATNQKDIVVGANAAVTIKGVQITSASNIIKDILPGVTVELKKPNDPTKDLTIEVTNVVEPITNSIISLVDAYNELMEFAEVQTKTAAFNGVPQADKEAFLARSASLRQTISSVKAIMNFVPGLEFALPDIGISKPAKFQDKPALNRLQISDPVKLRDAIVYRLDDIKKLFQNNAAVTKADAPTTANISLTRFSEMPGQALGKTIRLMEDGAGNITFTMQGVIGNQPANLVGNEISFPGTVLDGLKLVYTGGNNGTPQNFDIVLSQGIGDKFASQSVSLNNKIEDEGKVVTGEERKLAQKEIIAKEALAKKEKEIDDRVYKLELMDLLFNSEMDRLTDMLDMMFE